MYLCAVCIRHKGRPSYFLSAVANCPVFPIKSVCGSIWYVAFFFLLLFFFIFFKKGEIKMFFFFLFPPTVWLMMFYWCVSAVPSSFGAGELSLLLFYYILWALLLLLSVIIIMIIFFQKSQEREQPPNFNDLPSPSRSPPRPSVTSYLLYYSPIGDITGIHLSDILWTAVCCAAVGPSCLLIRPSISELDLYISLAKLFCPYLFIGAMANRTFW